MQKLKFVLAAAIALTLSGCIDWDNQTRYGGPTKTNAEIAYDSSVRVERLLDACGTAECQAAKAKIHDIGARLIAHANAALINANVSKWYADESKLLDEYSEAKRQAYQVLLDSGWVAPAGTDGAGAWDATWWDFSSP